MRIQGIIQKSNKTDRNQSIIALKYNGKKIVDLAKEFNLTIGRISFILKRGH